ncbi:hypothetical protein ACO4IW_002157, partial [Neisseria gonorrhoeae]
VGLLKYKPQAAYNTLLNYLNLYSREHHPVITLTLRYPHSFPSFPQLFVIPTKVGIRFFEFQSFPINCLSIECLDSRLRGNDGGAVSVFSDKCRNLKSRHSHESGNLGLSAQKLIG